jgi:uridine phosphorylase
MAATWPDFEQLRRRLAISPSAGDPLFMSRYCPGDHPSQAFGLVGPFMGAPQAAMLLETIAAWGARRFVFLGWCGSLASTLKSGDIVLPCGAFVDEGTSPAYGCESQRVRPPVPDFQSELNTHFHQAGLACQEGWIWTTDAVFRETEHKVRHYQDLGALAVEMELSALYTVAGHLSVDLGAVLVVSDELSTFKWRPGFKSESFKAARRAVVEAIASYVECTPPA